MGHILLFILDIINSYSEYSVSEHQTGVKWEMFSKLLAHQETYDCQKLLSSNVSLFQIKRNVLEFTRS